MKRILIIVAAGLVAAGSLSAQAMMGRGYAPNAAPQAQVPAAEVVKVEGKLSLVNGMFAVVAKDKTYYVGGLQRLFGFVDGLKDGATVKLEGSAYAVPLAPEYQHLMATKLTFNGKDYDLSAMGGRGGRGGMMGGAMGGYPGAPNNGAPMGRGGRR
jgi:hypothetical protein